MKYITTILICLFFTFNSYSQQAKIFCGKVTSFTIEEKNPTTALVTTKITNSEEEIILELELKNENYSIQEQYFNDIQKSFYSKHKIEFHFQQNESRKLILKTNVDGC